MKIVVEGHAEGGEGVCVACLDAAAQDRKDRKRLLVSPQSIPNSSRFDLSLVRVANPPTPSLTPEPRYRCLRISRRQQTAWCPFSPPLPLVPQINQGESQPDLCPPSPLRLPSCKAAHSSRTSVLGS
ncbi:hypothetical protein BaRGS_00016997 [Batillaria attramentaria]|uniref:Uncharacterized protein n=1 Tax=Batillaria attramentaria TaxID=370345 RepID=A0ABD0KWR1_9CAEN